MKKAKRLLLIKTIGFYINCLSYINTDKARDVAYKYFSQPRKGRLNLTSLPKTLQQATIERFVCKGEIFHTYIWRGNRDVVLLAHGWESNASRWKKLVPLLRELNYTVIAIDAPAHGLSNGKEFNTPKYAEYLEAVIQKYQPKTVIGHSIGGIAINYYIKHYPNDSIEKVILLGAPSNIKKINANFVALLSLNNKIKNRLEALHFEKFNISLDDFSGHKFVQDFQQKALIIHDVKDKIVKVDDGRKYAESWKNSIYIETKGLGHSLQSRNLYKKVTDFIKVN